VYTSEDELRRTVEAEKVLDQTPKDLPRGFVRFVYCLGYGENDLLDKCIKSNRGTPSFWKIFYSCINPITPNPSFAPVLKTTTELLKDRIGNKLCLLRQMKDQDIWLVDASIIALYRSGQPKPPYALYRRVLQTSWEEHVRIVLQEAQPDGILCIGLGVATVLQSQLKKLGIPCGAVPQPNAHLPREEHSCIFKTYRRVAEEPARVLEITTKWSRDLFP